MKVFYNQSSVYETIYAYFTYVIHPEWEFKSIDEFSELCEGEYSKISFDEFNLNDICNIDNYPMMKIIQKEIDKEDGRWDWMISLSALINSNNNLSQIDKLLKSERSFEKPKTESILIKINNNYYWADKITDKEPWKFDYSYLKKYPTKADFLISGNLIHSLRKTQKVIDGKKYHYHSFQNNWIEPFPKSFKLFDFDIEKINYDGIPLHLLITKNEFSEIEIQNLIRLNIHLFLKNKFQYAVILVFMTSEFYLFMFNEYSNKIIQENGLYLKIMPQQILRLSKFEHQEGSEILNTVTRKLKPLSEILEWIREAFLSLNNASTKTKINSDNDINHDSD